MNPALAFPEFVRDVETRLAAQLHGPPEDGLLTAARHLVLGPGGKRGRPLLVRVFGDALGVKDEQKLVDVAVAAELIHSASLLHDDVVDVGMFRRGRPTVNARWGNVVAVMSGDLLLSSALLELAKVDARITKQGLSVISEMTRAAIAEVNSRGNLDHSLAALRAVAEGKTGSLFGFCGLAAATLAGDEASAKQFDAFGRRLGVAFQMADDIRDLTGTDEGKPQYADIQSLTPSLPVLLAFAKEPKLKSRFRDVWAFGQVSADRAKELGTAVLCTGAIEDATQQMEREIAQAVEALGPWAQTPSGMTLIGWADALTRGVALKGAA